MIYNSRYVPRTAVCCRHNCGGSGSTSDHLCSQYTFQTEIYRALPPVVGRMDGRTDVLSPLLWFTSPRPIGVLSARRPVDKTH